MYSEVEYQKAYRAKNKDRKRILNREYYLRNKPALRAYYKQWYSNNKLRHSRVCNENKKGKPQCIIRSRLSNALWHALHSQSVRKSTRTMPLLGCSMPDFIIYLESKFESGMTWENYGRKGWHIDHIMPCAIFDLTKPEHQRRCFHFSNMQPMWSIDNHRKGARVSLEQLASLK